jgi:hypothetical protein
VDGDGLADLVVGNSRYPSSSTAGSAYLIWGFRGGLPHGMGIPLSTPLPDYFTTILGANAGDWFGSSAAGADFNHDGHPDFTIGAPLGRYSATSPVLGVGYTLFGHARPWPATINAGDLANGDGSTGFAAFGPDTNGQTGQSIAMLRHFSDSPYGDIAYGTPLAHVAGDVSSSSGAVDVLHGQSISPAVYALGFYLFDPGRGYALYGGVMQNQGNPSLGYGVASAGDVNHDGYEDLIVGAPGDNNYSGTAFVVFGQPTPQSSDFNLSALDGSNGFHIDAGYLPDSSSGKLVGSLGDINGDGIDDFFVATWLSTGCYITALFGRDDGFPALLDPAGATVAGRGFFFNGIGRNNGGTPYCWGISAAGVGDVNGDGIDDFAVGDNAGHVYLVFGHRGPWIRTMDAGKASVIKLTSILLINNRFGAALAGLGDVNGDGIDDFAIGAPAWNSGQQGVVMVVYGRDGIFDDGFD